MLTRRQWLRNPWYMDGPSRTREHEMKMLLPAPVGIVRGFWFDRDADGRDFDDRDRMAASPVAMQVERSGTHWGA